MSATKQEAKGREKDSKEKRNEGGSETRQREEYKMESAIMKVKKKSDK